MAREARPFFSSCWWEPRRGGLQRRSTRHSEGRRLRDWAGEYSLPTVVACAAGFCLLWGWVVGRDVFLLGPRVVSPHPQGLQGSHLNLSQTSAQRHKRYFLLNNKAVNTARVSAVSAVRALNMLLANCFDTDIERENSSTPTTRNTNVTGPSGPSATKATKQC